MKKTALLLSLVLCQIVLNAGRTRSVLSKKDQGTSPKAVVDIEMTDIWLEQCRVWVRYSNKGTVKIDAVLRENVWVGDLLQQSHMRQVVLEPGAVFAHGVGSDPGVKITGTKTVRAMIDADNVLTESNKANNTKQVQLTCPLKVRMTAQQTAKPDLIVAIDFKHMTRKDSGGQNVYSCDIEFTVTNQGSGHASPCTILLERDSGPGGLFVPCGPEISVPAINGHQSYTTTSGPYQHTGPAPTYRATVDSKHAVDESDETNNVATKKFPS